MATEAGQARKSTLAKTWLSIQLCLDPWGTQAWWSDKSEMAALVATTGSMPASPVVTDTQCLWDNFTKTQVGKITHCSYK